MGGVKIAILYNGLRSYDWRYPGAVCEVRDRRILRLIGGKLVSLCLLMSNRSRRRFASIQSLCLRAGKLKIRCGHLAFAAQLLD